MASTRSTCPTTNWPSSISAIWWAAASPLAHDELLFRFEFPERPGALMKFLSSMSPNWNISLFHYRNQGADASNILVGIQVPKNEKRAFRDFLSTLGYVHWDETDNPVYKLFLS